MMNRKVREAIRKFNSVPRLPAGFDSSKLDDDGFHALMRRQLQPWAAWSTLSWSTSPVYSWSTTPVWKN